MANKPIISGFCGNGHHEGLSPVNYQGKPLPTCVWLPCRCQCHKKLDEMFELAGQERVGRLPNPKYIPERSPFVMPEQTLSTGTITSSNIDHTDAPLGPQIATAGVLDRLAGRSFGLTPSGIRARGQLEYEVLAVCRAFDNKVYDWDMCVTKNVAEAIDKADPPSSGAIQAVWERWARIGFATYAKKPLRFYCFNDNSGTAEELDLYKLNVKKKKARSKAEARRGIRHG